MKNLLLSVLIMFSTSIQSQDLSKKLKGVWSSDTTSYYVVILHNDKEFKFVNFSFVDNDTVIETVVEQKDDYVKTKIYNPKNKWEVFLTYKYVDQNTLSVKFEGSTDRTSIYKRHWIMTN